jgi:hypothetical protein
MLESAKQKVKDRDFTVIAHNLVKQAIGEQLDGSPFRLSAGN